MLSESSLPVLVDFWAPWCGPCRSVAPEIDKVAERHAGRLLVVKVNTDVDPAVGSAHRIQSIPTMALFQGGREVAREIGARPAAAIESFVRQSLGRLGGLKAPDVGLGAISGSLEVLKSMQVPQKGRQKAVPLVSSALLLERQESADAGGTVR